MDEEKQALREERKAFELLVSAQTKQLSHVGNIQDDEASSIPDEDDSLDLKKQQEVFINQIQINFDKKLEDMNLKFKKEHVLDDLS